MFSPIQSTGREDNIAAAGWVANAVHSYVDRSHVAVEVALGCYEKVVQIVAGSDMIVGCHSLKGVVGSEVGDSLGLAVCVQYQSSQCEMLDYPISSTVHHCKLGHCILGTAL